MSECIEVVGEFDDAVKAKRVVWLEDAPGHHETLAEVLVIQPVEAHATGPRGGVDELAAAGVDADV
jgi:hypothetical protein